LEESVGMKENVPSATEMTDSQRRVFIDAAQVYEAYTEAFREARAFRGGMHWKKSKGQDYLFRSRDRFGYGKSLGPRSVATEKILADFVGGKGAARERLDSLKARLKEQARFCRAAAIQRVPRVLTGILRVLDRHHLLGNHLTVIGTNAVYAYEAAAGVFLDRPLPATGDHGMLWDLRPRLRLAAGEGAPSASGLLDLLRKADRSFARDERQPFRAVNKDGYMVDLVVPGPRPAIGQERPPMGSVGDREAAEMPSLQWLAADPTFRQVVIGDDGCPAAMVCPDPRAFARCKIRLSEEAERNPLKTRRDRHQGIAVAWLVRRYLPRYPFAPEDLRLFPAAVRESATQGVDQEDTPAGME
jgi:hypothetical protein